MRIVLRFVFLVLSVTPATAGFAQNTAGYAILKKYCASCHGTAYKHEKLDLLNRDSAVAHGVLGTEDPANSRIWKRAGVAGDMPPERIQPRPSEEELAVLLKWLKDGAAYPVRRRREHTSFRKTLELARKYLDQREPEVRQYVRFFTLANIANNAAGVLEEDYLRYQRALTKSVNSLSWEQELTPPEVVDRDQRTLFAIDLRDYGWHVGNQWKQLLVKYPYALNRDHHHDRQVSQAARDVYRMTGSLVPIVRADWFIATATRPPLYHTLLKIPATDRALELKLGVDVANDFKHGELQRAGFVGSGVSKQNRLVDRHRSRYGVYWKSYDFISNTGRGNLLTFPLGPEMPEHSFSGQAFAHDGGEIIFSLPNGLHGYMLVDGAGKRIDAGPVQVVSDPHQHSGTAEIVTGLSCIACHKRGVLPIQDGIRLGTSVRGLPLRKVNQLFPRGDKWKVLIDHDRSDYEAALRTAGAWGGGDELEPISAVAKVYQSDLDANAAAAELGLSGGGAELARRVANSGQLKKLGLGPLSHQGAIKRDAWDSLEGTRSLFQRVALEFELGTPHREFAE